jgi:hypothetical protein
MAAAASRALLALALLALLCGAAVAAADRRLLDDGVPEAGTGGGKGRGKGLAKQCAKALPGCSTCTGTKDAGDLLCVSCASARAGLILGQCVCDAPYGTVTKEQLKAIKKASKTKGNKGVGNRNGSGNGNGNGKSKHDADPCVLCSDVGLVWSASGACV